MSHVLNQSLWLQCDCLSATVLPRIRKSGIHWHFSPELTDIVSGVGPDYCPGHGDKVLASWWPLVDNLCKQNQHGGWAAVMAVVILLLQRHHCWQQCYRSGWVKPSGFISIKSREDVLYCPHCLRHLAGVLRQSLCVLLIGSCFADREQLPSTEVDTLATPIRLNQAEPDNQAQFFDTAWIPLTTPTDSLTPTHLGPTQPAPYSWVG